MFVSQSKLVTGWLLAGFLVAVFVLRVSLTVGSITILIEVALEFIAFLSKFMMFYSC